MASKLYKRNREEKGSDYCVDENASELFIEDVWRVRMYNTNGVHNKRLFVYGGPLSFYFGTSAMYESDTINMNSDRYKNLPEEYQALFRGDLCISKSQLAQNLNNFKLEKDPTFVTKFPCVHIGWWLLKRDVRNIDKKYV